MGARRRSISWVVVALGLLLAASAGGLGAEWIGYWGGSLGLPPKIPHYPGSEEYPPGHWIDGPIRVALVDTAVHAWRPEESDVVLAAIEAWNESMDQILEEAGLPWGLAMLELLSTDGGDEGSKAPADIVIRWEDRATFFRNWRDPDGDGVPFSATFAAAVYLPHKVVPFLGDPCSDLAAAGSEIGPGTIVLNRANPVGWFVDPLLEGDEHFKKDDVLFCRDRRRKILLALEGSPAHGRHDLYTVVLHELGHALGLIHSGGCDGNLFVGEDGDDDGRLMWEGYLTDRRSLESHFPVGERRQITAEDLEMLKLYQTAAAIAWMQDTDSEGLCAASLGYGRLLLESEHFGNARDWFGQVIADCADPLLVGWAEEGVIRAGVAESATARNGAWFDEVIIQEATTSGAAVQQIQGDVIDAYAFSVGDADLFNIVQDDPNLDCVMSFGGFNDLTFNHGGPYSENGTLNPFGVAEFREAMHWLINREYIANEIWKGLSVPKYSYLNSNYADATRYRDIMDEIEEYYAHDPEKAYGIMEGVMLDLGAYREGGIWYWEGDVVEIIFLIRVEDERLPLGQYVAGLLEEFGFEVTRMERVSRELVPLWILSNPDAGLWHVYTGGWISTAISRDQGTGFNQFHTGRVLPWPLFTPLTDEKVNAVVPGLTDVLDKLANRTYASMEERRDLFEEALWGCNKFANMIWVVDNTSFAPFASDIAFAADLAGGFVGSTMWANPVYRMDADGNPIAGGTFTVATSTLLIEPWNPIAGSNWVYDMFPIRGTGESATAMDVNTGLVWPLHFERGEVFIKEGLPVGLSDGKDWCTLTFVDEIVVPADAWVDWDATSQTFITVGEKYPDGVTDATRKSVVYYPESLYDVPLHDGSTISIADFVLGIILSFDRAKPESPIFDESAVAGYNSFMSVFRGVKIVSENPLVIETYSTLYTLDAELAVSTWFPYYAQGPGFWHVISLGIMAEQEKVMAFSADKSEQLQVEWCNLITGPSLEILETYVIAAKNTAFVPYKPTLGQYITTAEANERWTNLLNWYEAKDHFWVTSGLYYLDGVFPTEKVLTLKRFEDYPFPADRFQFMIDERP